MTKIEELRAQVNELHDQIRAIQNAEHNEKNKAAVGKFYQEKDRSNSAQLTHYIGVSDEALIGLRVTKWNMGDRAIYFIIENVGDSFVDEDMEETTPEAFDALMAEAKAAMGL